MYYVNIYTCTNSINVDAISDIIEKWIKKNYPEKNTISVMNQHQRHIRMTVAKLLQKEIKIFEPNGGMTQEKFKEIFEGNTKNHFLQIFLANRSESKLPFYSKISTTNLLIYDSARIILDIGKNPEAKKYISEFLSEYYSFMVQLICYILNSFGYFNIEQCRWASYYTINRMLGYLVNIKKMNYDHNQEELMNNLDVYKKWVNFFSDNSENANLIVMKIPLLNLFFGKAIISRKMNSNVKILALLKSQILYFMKELWYEVNQNEKITIFNNYFNIFYGDLPNIDELPLYNDKKEIKIKESDSDIIMEGTLIEV